jgi:hypothetical protein
LSGSAKGMTYQELIRQHGLTYFQNGPDGEITSLSRALFGRP